MLDLIMGGIPMVTPAGLRRTWLAIPRETPKILFSSWSLLPRHMLKQARMSPGQAKTAPMTMSLHGVMTLQFNHDLHAIGDKQKIGPSQMHQTGTTMLGLQAMQKSAQLVAAKRKAVK